MGFCANRVVQWKLSLDSGWISLFVVIVVFNLMLELVLFGKSSDRLPMNWGFICSAVYFFFNEVAFMGL